MDELRFTYTEADYLKACKLSMKSGAARNIFWAATGMSLVLAYMHLKYTDVTTALLHFPGIPLAVWFLISLLLPLVVKKRIREIPWMRGEVVLRCQEDRIVLESLAGKWEQTWFLRVMADAEMLVLMTSQLSCMYIPRRVCADAAQFERIAAVGRRLAGKETT